MTFAAGAANPVDLQIGPGGDLFYVDIDGGDDPAHHATRPATSRRSRWPTATPTSGSAPLHVQFDGSHRATRTRATRSSYAWDLDGDGQYDDSTRSPRATTTRARGVYTASLRVTDNHGESSTAAVTITVGNIAARPRRSRPAGAGTTWKRRLRHRISPAVRPTHKTARSRPRRSRGRWSSITVRPTATHTLQTFDGVAGGSFTAPDHEYPTHLELRLTATDSGGLTDTKSVELDPRTADLTLNSSPTGFALALNGSLLRTPFTKTVIQGSRNTISAPTPQTKGASSWSFQAWSDGRAQTHDVIRGQPLTYTATYKRALKGPHG